MFWRKRDKERERFYLLAGMGGRALRRKHRRFLAISIALGITVSFILAITLYYVNQHQ